MLGGAADPASGLTIQGSAASAVEGSQFMDKVATFTDPLTLTCQPSAYTASVMWADHTSSAATVGVGAAEIPGCTFPLTATHTFAEEGSEPATVTVTPTGAAPVSADASVTVVDAPLTSPGGSQVSVAAGVAFTGAVASFADADPNRDPAATSFQTTINWGDGSSTGNPTISVDPAGVYTVAAGHTYAAAGSYVTETSITDDGGQTVTATGAVTVTTPPPPSPPGPPGPVNPTTLGAPPILGLSVPRVAGPRTLALRLTCPATVLRCPGVARVIVLPGRTQPAPLTGGASLGSTLFVLAPGESRTATIGVPMRLRKALRHARFAHLAGVAIAFGASGHSVATTGPAAVVVTTGLR